MTGIVSMAVVVTAVWAMGAPVAGAQAFPLSPPKDDGPVVVRTNFELRDINAIDDEAETFELSGVLTLTWRDPRCAFDPVEAGVDEKVYQGDYQFNELGTSWFPQVVLVNESGQFEKRGVILRVRPDGTSMLTETVNAVAEARLDLRRYPFDRQRLEAVFEVLGADNTEVVLRAEGSTEGSPDRKLHTPQWTLTDVGISVRGRPTFYSGRQVFTSALVLGVDVERDSFFVVRLIVIPLVLIVMLSWSVFWMERSSLGDRISVSFIGILTAVAYQNIVSEIQPHISYLTLMHGFLNLSLLVMSATVVINLVVGAFDRRGKEATGDRVDRACRWIFPLTYFGLNALMVGVAFVFF
jgi:hypothetical protein